MADRHRRNAQPECALGMNDAVKPLDQVFANASRDFNVGPDLEAAVIEGLRLLASLMRHWCVTPRKEG